MIQSEEPGNLPAACRALGRRVNNLRESDCPNIPPGLPRSSHFWCRRRQSKHTNSSHPAVFSPLKVRYKQESDNVSIKIFIVPRGAINSHVSTTRTGADTISPLVTVAAHRNTPEALSPSSPTPSRLYASYDKPLPRMPPPDDDELYGTINGRLEAKAQRRRLSSPASWIDINSDSDEVGENCLVPVCVCEAYGGKTVEGNEQPTFFPAVTTAFGNWIDLSPPFVVFVSLPYTFLFFWLQSVARSDCSLL